MNPSVEVNGVIFDRILAESIFPIMRAINLIITVVLIFLAVSCSSSKKQEAAVKEKNVPEEAKPEVVAVPVLLKTDHVRFDMEEIKKRMEAADSIYASIKRTPCYGRCPIYEAVIYKSGYVIYNGNRFVERIGKHKSRLTQDQLAQIATKANSIGYFELENKYDSPVTDFPTTITAVNASGKSKTISNRVGGPDSLKEYEKYLDGLLNGLGWTKIADDNQ